MRGYPPEAHADRRTIGSQLQQLRDEVPGEQLDAALLNSPLRGIKPGSARRRFVSRAAANASRVRSCLVMTYDTSCG
jgi:hypothetical protein